MSLKSTEPWRPRSTGHDLKEPWRIRQNRMLSLPQETSLSIKCLIIKVFNKKYSVLLAEQTLGWQLSSFQAAFIGYLFHYIKPYPALGHQKYCDLWSWNLGPQETQECHSIFNTLLGILWIEPAFCHTVLQIVVAIKTLSYIILLSIII